MVAKFLSTGKRQLKRKNNILLKLSIYKTINISSFQCWNGL